MQAAALPPIYLDIHEGAPADAAPRAAPNAGWQAWGQLGAWRTRRKAEEVLRAARAASPADPPLPIRVFPVRARGGVWWRVVAGPYPPQTGHALCIRLAARGYDCVAHEEPFALGTSRTRHRLSRPAH